MADRYSTPSPTAPRAPSTTANTKRIRARNSLVGEEEEDEEEENSFVGEEEEDEEEENGLIGDEENSLVGEEEENGLVGERN